MPLEYGWCPRILHVQRLQIGIKFHLTLREDMNEAGAEERVVDRCQWFVTVIGFAVMHVRQGAATTVAKGFLRVTDPS